VTRSLTRHALALLMAFLPLCGCDRNANERHEQIEQTQQAVVPGVETVSVALEEVRDVVRAFATVAAEAEAPELRDARAQLAEADARQQLATQTVRRLEALARTAVAPQKELQAARAEQAATAATAARARQVLTAFGSSPERTPLASDEIWVLAQIVQADVGQITVGSSARFIADAFPSQQFTGTVDATPAYIDQTTRTAPVRLRVRDAGHRLRPGMTGAAMIEVGALRAAVVVPSVAVVYDAERPVVFIEESAGHYSAHAVQLGVARDGRIEITGGLSAGARVATTGAASLLSAVRLPGASDVGP
jgi:multidrug efflux pump subunit AcrA (membrane-fusion protein)